MVNPMRLHARARRSNIALVAVAAELLAANGNRGAELLEPGEFAGAIKYLNRLDELGVGGVTVAIGYPLFTPSFPRYQEYVSFYRRIAGEVRKRGMKLDVEALVLFANTPFSPIKWDFTGLTLERYKAEALQMDQAIIKEVAPDYLDIGAEPDTAARLLGMPELGTPTVFADYARYISSGLVKGSTLVFLGAAGPGVPEIDGRAR